jgi:hypothetical protein
MMKRKRSSLNKCVVAVRPAVHSDSLRSIAEHLGQISKSLLAFAFEPMRTRPGATGRYSARPTGPSARHVNKYTLLDHVFPGSFARWRLLLHAGLRGPNHWITAVPYDTWTRRSAGATWFSSIFLFGHQNQRRGGDESHSRGTWFLFCCFVKDTYTVRFVAQTTFSAPAIQSSESANDLCVTSLGRAFAKKRRCKCPPLCSSTTTSTKNCSKTWLRRDRPNR